MVQPERNSSTYFFPVHHLRQKDENLIYITQTIGYAGILKKPKKKVKKTPFQSTLGMLSMPKHAQDVRP